jgi:PEP-CTERM motif
MNIRLPFSFRGRIVRWTSVAALMACAVPAQAAIQVGESLPESVAAGVTPELVLVIWDPVKEVSYTRDLGISIYKEFYSLGNTSTNLFVYGQQETFHQQLTTLNTDANFLSFLSKSTDVANQIWAVVGLSVDPNGGQVENGTSLFTTLKHTASTGVVDSNYTKLIDTTNTALAGAGGNLAQFLTTTSNKNGTCDSTCVIQYADNSSYVNVKGQTGYASNGFQAGGLLPSGDSKSPSLFNAVNSSSWFYAATVTSDGSDDKIAVDEFDNLAHDAYWGLGVAANGDYILSYTMEASLSQAQTLQGQMLRLRTDFAASYGGTRLISAPVGDKLNLGGSVSAVPEPSTWGLMGLGLALLACRARRHNA